MKRSLLLLALLFAALILIPSSTTLAQTTTLATTFTYQGYLANAGGPVTGACDVQFSLFNALSGGTQIGSTLTKAGTAVNNGVFTSQLDFGAGAFDGTDRYLQVSVRCPGGAGVYTDLTPRQPVTPALYAMFATGAPWSGLTGIPAGFGDGVDNDVLAGLTCANGQLAKWNGAAWVCAADNDTTYTAGAGLNLAAGQFSLLTAYQLPQSCANNELPKWNGAAWACAADNTSTGNWLLTGNSSTTPGTDFLGTTDNQPFEVRVNNLRVLWLEPQAISPNILGGSHSNTLTSGIYGGTVSGGGYSTFPNKVTDNFGTVAGGAGNQAGNNAGTTSDAHYATVSGGYYNRATIQYGTIGGGYGNQASGDYATIAGGSGITASGQYVAVGGGIAHTVSGSWSTVGGGNNNTVAGSWATIGGGYNNSAGANYAVVGGGTGNSASQTYATVPGGNNNNAAGSYSFAAGNRAKANHSGAFVWGDNTTADVASSGNNQFIARAVGGVTFYTNTGLTTGATLAAGSGSWASVSDRQVKANFTPVDGHSVLDKVVALPLSTWNYQSQDAGIRHIGPMAQDFKAAFGVGEDDKHISMVDADGVALAAIQGLYNLVQEKDKQLSAQQKQIDDLNARLAALEKLAGTTSNPRETSALPGWLLMGGLVVGGLIVIRRQNRL
jgi:hypothetical protein